MAQLDGKKVAILVADGFEQVEFTKPKQALVDAGADVHVVSLNGGQVKGWNETDWGEGFDVDVTIDSVKAEDYNALILPGGVMNPDNLRKSEQAVTFVRDFFKQHKPVAAICHAPWMLIEAGVVEGRKLTSYDSIKTDLKNAGANWVDQEVVTDQGLVTSRNPDDLPAFIDKMIEEIREGRHEQQVA